MFRPFSVLPLILFPVATSLLPAQTQVQEIATISSHSWLGARVTAYGGYAWPYMRGSLKIEPAFLTNPAIEVGAYAKRPTGGRDLLPSCQTYIRVNGTTRASASRTPAVVAAGSYSPPLACSLSSLLGFTVLPASAREPLTFGATGVRLATTCSVSGSTAASFDLGAAHEMDNAVMFVQAVGATTVVLTSGSTQAGILSVLDYGTHTARVDDAFNQNAATNGTVSWWFGAAVLQETLWLGTSALSNYVHSFAARSGNRSWWLSEG